MAAVLFADRYELRGGAREGRLCTELPALDTRSGAEVVLWLPHEALVPSTEARGRVLAAAQALRVEPVAGLLPISDAGDDERLFIAVPAARRPMLPMTVFDHPIGLPSLALAFAQRLARALDAAHALGMVHGCLGVGDLWALGGQLSVSGVGLWQHCEPGALRERLLHGTPLAPEVRADVPPTAATDVWSLAALCRRLCVGASVTAEEALAHAYPRVSAALSPALSDHAADRPGTCFELVVALEAALAPRRTARGSTPPPSGPQPTLAPRAQPAEAAERKRPPPPPKARGHSTAS
jgi:hypothetical protein